MDKIIAREALAALAAIGRPTREAASFLSEQCYEQRLHGWGFVNTDSLSLIPHHIWPVLMWFALPDDTGTVCDESDKLSVVGNWIDGRISYWPKSTGFGSDRYNIQGLRFDRAEFESLVPIIARDWLCEPIGALPLNKHEGAPSPPHDDQERRTWMSTQPVGNADQAFDVYKRHAQRSRIKRDAFRAEWKDVHNTQRGRSPSNRA